MWWFFKIRVWLKTHFTRQFAAIEFCQLCGCEQPVVWHADDALYLRVTGDEHSVYCPTCFDDLAEHKGIWLNWQPLTEFIEL
jgi:hypothetical protein